MFDGIILQEIVYICITIKIVKSTPAQNEEKMRTNPALSGMATPWATRREKSTKLTFPRMLRAKNAIRLRNR